MDDKKLSPIADPGIDIGQRLRILMGDTGGVHESLGGFQIEVYHTRGFPWADVFKTLLDHQFRVYVTRRKADVRIEASI